MSEYYPVVKVLPEWRDEDEDMGSRDKFWYREPGEGRTWWLFKCPTGNRREYLAEKVVAEVAELLGISHAPVELAKCEGVLGSTTESFVGKGLELRHGNVVLEGALQNPEGRELNFHASDHNLGNIWAALERVFADSKSVMAAKRRFVQYILLDAVVGNVDRHSQNWGILVKDGLNDQESVMAPSYDHGSSFGRVLTDEDREKRLANNEVGTFAERGRGGIFWSETDRHGLSPIGLARMVARLDKDIFAAACERPMSLEPSQFSVVFDKVPIGWMSEPYRRFAIELMTYNYFQLNELWGDIVQ